MIAGLDARTAALRILERIDRDGATLDAALEVEMAESAALPRRDRNLAFALALGVLRWRRALDDDISGRLRNPRQKTDPTALNILRMGLFQLRFMDRIPPSAAVNTSVELAKLNAPPHLTGFVNGILRNAIRNPAGNGKAIQPIRSAENLARKASFPDWMVRRWADRFGLEETERLCESMNAVAPLTLRVNRLRTDLDVAADAIKSAADSVSQTAYSPDGLHVQGLSVGVSELPGFAEGFFQVQDEGAQLAVRHLAPAPGHRVLDACAGLGGKTGALAALMENQGEILAVDHQAGKLSRLREEMDRLGADIVQTAEMDISGEVPPEKWGRFDRILLDAPCSGLGVIRRNPDAKWAIEKRDLVRFQNRQVAFLERLADLLSPDGRMAYVVCTFEPEETGQVVDRFLERRPEFEVAPHDGGLPESAGSLANAGFLRLYPHRHGTDGFFSVGFRRKSE
jgi:16S rRNA (cytosine967-C5)-methyltransferase